MNLRFLCVNHRQWLIADPVRAERHWLEWLETGSSYYEQGLLHEAIPFFGCAFELSENLLTHNWPCIDTAVSRFTLSSICLAQSYELLGESETRDYLMIQASCRLGKEQPALEECTHVSRCMQSLHWLDPSHELGEFCTSIGLSNLLANKVHLVH